MKQDDKRKYDGFVKRLELLNGNGARNVFGYDLSYVIDASPYYVAVLVNQDSGEILNEVFYMVDGQLQYLSLLSIHSLVTGMVKHNHYFKKKEFQFITSKLDYFLFLALASCGKS